MNKQTKFKQTAIGMIPEDWEVVELKDILEDKGYIRGPFGSALRRPELKSEGIPVYEQENAICNSREFRYFINNEKFQKLSRFAVKENDLIISCSGTFGKVSIIRKEDPKGIISQALLILRLNTNKIKALYLKYFFTSDQGFNSIASRSLGSVQINIAKRGIIERIELPLPPLAEQRAIAKILSDLDTKIELNQNMNKTLEAIGQAIFKHWFIDFEFPNEDGDPYKSNGGEMVESELGPIPKGWGVIQFKEIIKISSGKRPKIMKKEKDKEFNIPLIGASSIMGYVRETLHAKPILIIGRVGTHGIVQRIKGKSWPSDNTLVIQPEYYEYTYQILKNINYQSLNRGSTQPLITQTDIKKYKIIFLKNNLLSDFEKIVGSLFQLINKNKEENRILSRIRDILLPKLMSGEIRII